MLAMSNIVLLTSIFASITRIQGLEQRTPFRVASKNSSYPVTNHVLPLVAAPYALRHPLPPSSKYLEKRFSRIPITLPANPLFHNGNRDVASDIQSEIDTLGGRVYMTNISIAGNEYSVIIDTGSSDTWLASSNFQCVSKYTSSVILQDKCGFGKPYDKDTSGTYVPIQSHRFGTSYTDGEFLSGELGIEELGIGGPDEDMVTVRQTIGVVERGYWNGDGISSGLIGLAYSGLVSHGKELGYTSLIFTLFQNTTIPPVFSLALSRPTNANPAAGGLLAIVGIPDIEHEKEFVTTPIRPMYAKNYALYAIKVDGFDIEAPSVNTNTSRSSTLNQATSRPTSLSTNRQSRLPKSNGYTSSRPTRPKTKTVKSNTPPSPSSPTAPPHNKPRQAVRPPNADPNSTIIFTPNLTMVIDSGTTLLYVPDDIAERIASLFVPRAVYAINTNTYMVPCSAVPPRIGIVIAGRSFYIHPDDLMNRAPGAVGGGGAVWMNENGESESVGVSGAGGLCTLAVQRKGLGDPVLGDSWLKNVLAVFDVGANEMRFAGRENY